MRGNRDVEVLRDCRQQMCDVALRTSSLREGYRDQQTRFAAGWNDALLRDWGCQFSRGDLARSIAHGGRDGCLFHCARRRAMGLSGGSVGCLGMHTVLFT